MGYSRQRPKVQVLEILGTLLETKANLVLHTEVPRRLAYQIREAMWNTKHYEDLKKFAPLDEEYSIRTREDHINCVYRGSTRVTKVEIKPRPDKEAIEYVPDPEPETKETLEADEGFSEELKEIMNTVTIEEFVSPFEILEGIKRFGQRVLEVHYPNAKLTSKDLGRIYSVVNEWGWGIIDMDDAGVTFTRKDIPEELRWRPEGFEPEPSDG